MRGLHRSHRHHPDFLNLDARLGCPIRKHHRVRRLFTEVPSDEGCPSSPPLHHLQIRLCKRLAHEGEGFGAAEVVVAGVGRAAGPLGGFRGADDGGGFLGMGL